MSGRKICAAESTALFVCCLAAAWNANGAAPAVSNVRAAQRPGAARADITSGLAAPDNIASTLAIALPANAGTTRLSPGASLTGQAGSGIAPGNGKLPTRHTAGELPASLFAAPRGRVTAEESSAPAGMALIPAGKFTMGNSMDPGEGGSEEMPQHAVHVSAFYMDRHEVTRALWDEVKAWKAGNGYSYEHAGSGKAAHHPVQTVNWRDCAKWCNARSEKEGLTPCYYNEPGLTTLYKTGKAAPYPKWDASGYRLPTEAEWEKAARGGAGRHRFPWNDTDDITQSRANYCSYWSESGPYYSYDLNPTNGYHPTFATNGFPYTSPVGYFEANGYGLHDMAGNVWEWCWDWYSAAYYNSSPATDPRGPDSGSYRVLRGGSWVNRAIHCRCADRFINDSTGAYNYNGFRCVRRL